METEDKCDRPVVIHDLRDHKYRVFWYFETRRLVTVSSRYPLKPARGTGLAVKAVQDVWEWEFNTSEFRIHVETGETTRVEVRTSGPVSKVLQAAEVLVAVEEELELELWEQSEPETSELEEDLQ